MFPCGHALCMGCTNTLIENNRSHWFGPPQVACPLCRESCATSDVNYVRLGNDADKMEEAEPVIGAHASKIVSVTQCLLRIQRKEPGAKAIVFSSVSLSDVPVHSWFHSKCIISHVPEVNVDIGSMSLLGVTWYYICDGLHFPTVA